ncbi:hypothetical protein GCM10009712_11120 [Pseudarthrobacter sulfonivorans]|uniref:hypothetical protein n=1 Tax=Pseudarthrobacter sulfonivorans TaxID=121292 RepID=UPI00168BBC47|nr:hypothetical protein [Pseudarthrobacter sulfonivorans]
MDNHAHGLSARGIGKQIGATAVEVNCLLKNQGFLYGEPGAYGLTPKGKEFGVQQVHDNGYGGFTHRFWETTHFAPNITEVLDSAPERLAEVREDILVRKEALSAARKVAQAQAEAHFQAFQKSKEAAMVEHEIDPQKVWLVIAGIVVIVGASYGAYKGVQWYRRKKAAQTDPDMGM